MANIQNELNNIKNALFGQEVRGSIHDGIDAINKEVESTTSRQVDLESTFDQLVINAGNSNAEIVDARVKADGTSYSKLGDRLDSVDSQLEHNMNEIKKIKNGVIHFDDYKPCKNNINDNSDILLLALNDCVREQKDLIVSNGVYKFNKTVEVELSGDIAIKGDSSVSFNKLKFYYTGNSNFLIFNNARNIYFENIEISGRDSNNSYCLTSGSVGIKSSGSIITNNCYFNGFDSIIEWAGGYYYKFKNTQFAYSNLCLKRFDGNNVIVDKCKVSKIGTFITVSSGNGGLQLTNSSFEEFAQGLFKVDSGSSTSINIFNCYFENYPKKVPPNGIIGIYNGVSVVQGYSNITLIGNYISSTGIKRFVNSNCKHIISLGNRIDVQENHIGDMEYYIYASNLETAICNDYSKNIFTHQEGVYSLKYISSNKLKKDTYMIYDCFKNEKFEKAYTTWTTIEPINGWKNSGTSSHSKLAYRIDGNRVTLRGTLTSTSATDDIICYLPENIKPISSLQIPTSTLAGDTLAIIRIASTESKIFSSFRSGTITLDNISYYID